MNITSYRPLIALVTLGVLASLVTFVYSNTKADATYPFKLGLDLAGGSHLVYEADTSKIAPQEVGSLMSVLREVIERRVNVFGVSEPIVQVEQSSPVSGDVKDRLVVELPGVTNIDEAVAAIGATPLLEFKLIDAEALMAAQVGESIASSSDDTLTITPATTTEPYIDTGLTGRYLKSASLAFAGQTGQGGLANEPIVSIAFNTEGGNRFEQITRDHVGEQLAIFLDGELLSAPNINEPITGGQAIISGGFSPDEAKALAENLNFGALPVPITLVSTQTIDASLGQGVLEQGVVAGVAGIALIALFMLVWYRLPGMVSLAALGFYVVAMLAVFQFIPVVLTAAGLAGFVLSLGMAVDANVLVFERMKEALREGKGTQAAAEEGFARAWSAIRDGNITSILSAIILFWFGTSLVKGFALVFGIGVLMSMLTAVTVTRTLLLALPDVASDSSRRFLYVRLNK